MAKIESVPSFVITLTSEEFNSLLHLLRFNENRIKDTHRTLLPLYDLALELDKKIIPIKGL